MSSTHLDPETLNLEALPTGERDDTLVLHPAEEEAGQTGALTARQPHLGKRARSTNRELHRNHFPAQD